MTSWRGEKFWHFLINTSIFLHKNFKVVKICFKTVYSTITSNEFISYGKKYILREYIYNFIMLTVKYSCIQCCLPQHWMCPSLMAMSSHSENFFTALKCLWQNILVFNVLYHNFVSCLLLWQWVHILWIFLQTWNVYGKILEHTTDNTLLKIFRVKYRN